MEIYSVFDKTANGYGRPFFALNDGMALRLFSQAVNDDNSDNQVSKFPQEHSLWHIGTFDDQTGYITADENRKVMEGIQVVEDKQVSQSALEAIQGRIDTIYDLIKKEAKS